MPTAFTLPSFAKINWNLRILGKRADGFHELCTLFQTVSLCDELTFAEHDDLVLSCDDETVPAGGLNLIIRAAKALQERSGTGSGAQIHLKKRIPSPGGLGGGSSNAAVALIGLVRLWEVEIGLTESAEIGARLGSDVPFFFYGGTALGTGRGEHIETVPEINEKYLLIVMPGMHVSTREAFERLDRTNLTKEDPKSILQICRFEAESLNLRQRTLINDFEGSVFGLEPEIARVKKTLRELGAIQAMLSGSGASVFAVFDKEETRQTALKALDIESTWRKFAVATVSRSEYRESLNIV